MPFAPPPPPVSYSRQVAPILALHCNGCHGDAGGLSTRSYADLMNGGNLGKVVMPGEPDRSLVIQFIEGRRGEGHRMPLGGRALSPEQIETIRRWIAEGAQRDVTAAKKYTRALTDIRLDRSKILRVFCRVDTEAYLTMTVRDPRNKRPLLTEVASIKSIKEQSDAGETGELISWDVRAGSAWPGSVDIELTIEYAADEPRRTEFFVRVVDR
jgi:Planctomycete cytochrome C